MHSLEFLTLAAGVMAGFLGALLGIGGGVLLVPLLNGFLGLSFAEARCASLIGVLGMIRSRVSDAMESGAAEWALLYVFSSW